MFTGHVVSAQQTNQANRSTTDAWSAQYVLVRCFHHSPTRWADILDLRFLIKTRLLLLHAIGLIISFLPAGAVILYAYLTDGIAGLHRLQLLLMLVAISICVWLLMQSFVIRPLCHFYGRIHDAEVLFSAGIDAPSEKQSYLTGLAVRFDRLLFRIKASQLELLESEERLRLTLSTNQQGLYDLNVQTGQVVVNPTYATMLGYAYEGFSESEESWRARLHPDDREGVHQAYREYLAGLQPDYRVEFRMRTADDRWIWIFSVGAIVSYDASGAPLRMLGTHLDITDRKLAQLRQSESDGRLAFALDAAGIGDWNMDLRTNIALRSLKHDQCFGYSSAVPEWGYETFLAHVHTLDRERVNEAFIAAQAGLGAYDVEFRTVWEDGSIHWLLSKGRFYFDQDGIPDRVAGILVDVTGHKIAEAALLDSESRYSLLFENSMDGVLQTSTDGKVVAANPAACAMFCLSEHEIVNRDRADLVDVTDPRLPIFLSERAFTGHIKTEIYMIRGDGTRFEAEVSSSVYKDYTQQIYTSMVIRDITERKKTEAEVTRLAFFDPLTGLPNRRLLMNRLEKALSVADRTTQIDALLFIDLDHFKYINDARGHGVGDAVLKEVACELTALLRDEDTLSRIGGDEFVVLASRLGNDFATATETAMATAERIRLALEKPITINGQQYTISGSIGVTLLPIHGRSADDLLREADTAMYRAKNTGRNRIVLFELNMQAEIENRLGIQRDLGLAIAGNQLEMYLQPQVNGTDAVVGAELLMRWTHPVKGMISPDVFIPVAEESGLIFQIGNWALVQGCHTIVRIREAGHDIPLSINISPHQFRQANFVAQIHAALAQSGADPTKLILEITEGLLIENIDETIVRMNEISRMGIRFSIDDFGTGYSSLSYLKRLPLFEIKIDKSFIRDMPEDLDDTAIVQSILSMAKHLNLRVVAEGVETRQQADFLIRASCDVMQGYLYSKPMPVDQWLHQQSS